MSLTCELSGEPLAATKETIVTTPSGHICLKRLLLQKLTENGGMDPFETIRERPLSEDQLVELKMKLEPPPRPQVTSLPNLLQMIQTEYDALVLELFDTRKALEETRRELSQALYQNDAAVRVVARLSMERDAAREELQRWSASAAPATTTTPLTDGVAADKEEPQAKRRKVERTTGPLSNDLPEDDVNAMVEMWNYLHTQRKPKLKAAAAKAPTADVVATYASKGTQNWHKATCRSLLCMMSRGDLLVTGGKDKQVVVYSLSEEVVKQSFNLGSVPNCVDASDSLVVAASAKGPVVVYSVADGSSMGEITVDSTEVVAVNLHPTGNHMCVLTADGRLLVCLVEEGKVSTVSEFKVDTPPEYTCGALHPDGLLYAAGTSTGEIHMWDFKSKTLASTMKASFRLVFVSCCSNHSCTILIYLTNNHCTGGRW